MMSVGKFVQQLCIYVITDTEIKQPNITLHTRKFRQIIGIRHTHGRLAVGQSGDELQRLRAL